VRQQGIATAMLFGYYLVTCLAIPMSLRAWRGMPDEVVRKVQHVGYGMSIWILLELFPNWYQAVAGAFVLVIVALPALLLLERWRGYARYFPDRAHQGGELRKSMLWVQLSFAVLLAAFWGVGGDGAKYLVAAGVMAWTFGDAAAALVGKFLGRRRVRLRLVDKNKTEEGTVAMGLLAFAALVGTLLIYGGLPWWVGILAAAVAASVAAMVELVSRNGTDTLTVPTVTAFAVLAVVWFTRWVGAWA
jgi:phytol kinase